MQHTAAELAFFSTYRPADRSALPPGVAKELQAIEALLAATPNTTLWCTACGSGEVGYLHKQTRSMDEGMTTFFTCRACAHAWKD